MFSSRQPKRGAWRGCCTTTFSPVTALRRQWFLDRGRKNPRLRITRLQFPLAPGFAITAHVAQGQTLRDGVIADFNISSVASVFTTYVAATRVTGRDKLLIMRPFPASPFQKGNSIGREVLLEVWRGDRVDWEALRANYLEERLCGECGENKSKAAFTVGQWKRMDADRCRECTARHRDAGEPYQCNVCRFWFSEEAFWTEHRRNTSSFYRVCSACETQKLCHRCNVRKLVTEFTASAWKARNANHWTCAICHLSLAQISRPPSKKGEATMPNHRRSPEFQCQGMTHRIASVRSSKIAMTPPKLRQRRTGLGPSQGETGKDAPNGCRNTNVSWTEYICPYCQTSVQSTVRNGNVQVAGHCSSQQHSLLPYVRRRGPIFVCSGTRPAQAQKTERKSMPDHGMAGNSATKSQQKKKKASFQQE